LATYAIKHGIQEKEDGNWKVIRLFYPSSVSSQKAGEGSVFCHTVSKTHSIYPIRTGWSLMTKTIHGETTARLMSNKKVGRKLPTHTYSEIKLKT